MKTIEQVLKLSIEHLQKKGIKNPRRQAEEVIADALEIGRLDLYTRFHCPLTDPELEKCREAIMRRGRGEPSQYIRGQVEFLNCILKVTPDVLIPRQETEILAEKVIVYLMKENLKGKVLWDVCCGSGCLGISIKKKFPELSVSLADISEKALDIAKENAERNDAEVTSLLGDLLSTFAGQSADFFVCNPPYISESEFNDLEIEVKQEPRNALIAGKTGLEFYRRLAEELPNYLKPNARIWFEIGYKQGEEIKQLFSKAPWASCEIQKDWSGHERFAFISL
jgi:release factor glutamine methyltransferase